MHRLPASRSDRSGPLLVGVRLGGSNAARHGDVSYRVIEPEHAEARRGQRLRTRLRSAKILDAANGFLCEALMLDRSAGGLRLLLARNIGLPARFAVHDDLSGEIVTVAMAWRRERTLGARILTPGPIAPIKRSDRLALRGRYYGVPD
jgi:hypothetical protein